MTSNDSSPQNPLANWLKSLLLKRSTPTLHQRKRITDPIRFLFYGRVRACGLVFLYPCKDSIDLPEPIFFFSNDLESKPSPHCFPRKEPHFCRDPKFKTIFLRKIPPTSNFKWERKVLTKKFPIFRILPNQPILIIPHDGSLLKPL